MSRPLRIAMIGTRGMPSSYGGVERAVEEISARLAAQGHEVTVYCRKGYTTETHRRYRGVRLRHLPTINTKHLEAITHSLIATLDAAFRRYDVIHYHATGPSLCAPLARFAGKRVIATVQGLDYRRAKWGRIARLVLRIGSWTAVRVPHATIVVSKTLRQHVREQYGVQTVYIPNGVASPQHATSDLATRGESQKGLYLLFLGRLVPEKGVHYLIEAFSGLDTDCQLVIAGPSSHSDRYIEQLRASATNDARVHLIGPTYGGEKVELLANAYAFCQTSDLEGLPISLLEAMSYGRCPIVSDLPEHLEVVCSDGPAAAYVFERGSVSSLRLALLRALRDPVEVERRGAVAAAIVRRHYNWDAIAAKTEEVCLSVFAHDRRRGPQTRVERCRPA